MKKTLSILAVLSLGTATFIAAENEFLENVAYAQEDEEVEEDVDEEEDEDTVVDEEDEEEVDPQLGQKLFAAFTQHSAVENYLFDI